jgi:hypothetical protein
MPNLPPFTIRESPRAKRVTLKVSVRHGLEVVIPPGFSRRQVIQFLHSKQDWIQQAFRKIQAAAAPLDQPRELPTTIHFPAVNLIFTVAYAFFAQPGLELVHHDPVNLQISGNTRDLAAGRNLLQRWLQHQGRVHLIPWLARLSSEIGFACRRVQIRNQKTRWGSCSSLGTISLNQNLLFLRPPLVRYLLIHELCHTVHLNHSASFYRLLAQFSPDYQTLRTELRQSRPHLPWWAH